VSLTCIPKSEEYGEPDYKATRDYFFMNIVEEDIDYSTICPWKEFNDDPSFKFNLTYPNC